MKGSRRTAPRLRVEPLEGRSLPATFGIPWLDPTALTLSFAPDGTDVGGQASVLTGKLGSTATQQAAWKKDVLRAFQTWAVQTNVNIGLVADAGTPMGSAGSPQGDARFGDLRIGARSLSTGSGNLAAASPFDYTGGTWSGNVLLNSQMSFGYTGRAGTYDLFTVFLQEAGHSLGLPNNATDPTSAMWTVYSQARARLAASDVAAVQDLYGVRTDDPYEGLSGNGTGPTAYDLTANGNLTQVEGDVTRVGDADFYKFTAPPASSGKTGLTVNLDVAGLSLLTARVTVYNAAMQQVATAVKTDPMNNNLAVAVPGYQAGAIYHVKVEGAGSDVFSVGAYRLNLNYTPSSGVTPTGPTVLVDGGTNESMSRATDLRVAGKTTHFAARGAVESASDVDWYKFTPKSSPVFTGTLTVGVSALAQGGLLPDVQVYDGQGKAVAATVAVNENGTLILQVANVKSGSTYFARVVAADPGGGRATGNYMLAADLAAVAPTAYDPLLAGTLSTATPTVYSRMTVASSRLTQFSLDVPAIGTDAAVRVSVYDAAGKLVFTLVAEADKTLTTGTVWLASGTYTVAINAATKSGAPLPNVAFTLRKRERSDPIDPYAIDPGIDPGGVVTTGPVTTALPGPIADPISNPYVIV